MYHFVFKITNVESIIDIEILNFNFEYIDNTGISLSLALN